jgi:hypothetical protein
MITRIKQQQDNLPIAFAISSVFEDLYPVDYLDIEEQYNWNTLELQLSDEDYSDIERDLEYIQLAVANLYPDIKLHIILNQLVESGERVKSVVIVGDKL